MTERFTFFWHGPFSQWHRSPFESGGVAYVTAEQYMMAGKARRFGDEETLAAILAADQWVAGTGPATTRKDRTRTPYPGGHGGTRGRPLSSAA